jgi:thiosulfate/3-mercaptopyruvate sulfurtransferase
MFTTLIQASDVYAHRNDPNWRFLDCRFRLGDTDEGRRLYKAGHLPGALYVHLDEDLSGPVVAGETGRHPLPSVAEAVKLFSALGIDEQVQVVAYDDMGGAIAARVWWMLHWLGHEAAAVLNGGIAAWEAAGYVLEAEQPRVTPRTFSVRGSKKQVVSAEDVDRIRGKGGWRVIDSRTPERYRGEEEPIDPVAGHIPGAKNAPHPETIGADGQFKSAEELRKHFSDIIGETSSEQTVFYCGSGVTACRNLLAYQEAGLGDAALYAGSWSDWIAPGTRPVATGED